jgi:prepilin-type N-terminal cleavage/methylation domain-containing protein
MDLEQSITRVGRGRDVSRGFTLVELLVVISTIALLLALLMPALAMARSQAHGLVCRSNLRQLVLAAVGYTAEHDGLLRPRRQDMLDGAGRCRWHGVRPSLDEPFEASKGPLAGYLADGKVRECPARVAFVKSKDWNTSFEQGCGGYGYNMVYLGSRLWDSGISGPQAAQQAYARTTRVNEVATPAQTLMFAEPRWPTTAIRSSSTPLRSPPLRCSTGRS